MGGIEKKHFFGGAPLGAWHGRGQSGDKARHWNARCNALSNGTAHRMPSQNRSVAADYPSRKQFAEQRFTALLRARRRKWPGRASVSRQIRNVHAQALLGKTPREIRHDFFV